MYVLCNTRQHYGLGTRAHDALMLSLLWQQRHFSVRLDAPSNTGITCAKGQNHEHRKVRSLPIFGAVLAMSGNALEHLRLV